MGFGCLSCSDPCCSKKLPFFLWYMFHPINIHGLSSMLKTLCWVPKGKGFEKVNIYIYVTVCVCVYTYICVVIYVHKFLVCKYCVKWRNYKYSSPRNLKNLKNKRSYVTINHCSNKWLTWQRDIMEECMFNLIWNKQKFKTYVRE